MRVLALALLEAGSDRRAYLLKDRVDDRSQLVGAIRSVAAGGSYIDPKVVERLVAAKGAAERSPLAELTPRELDVLREMAQGANNAAIATWHHKSCNATRQTSRAIAVLASCWRMAARSAWRSG